MRASVISAPKTLQVRDIEVPAVAPHEVLVEVEACGVCGTDLHMVVEGWGQPGKVGGHEWSGRIVGLGSEVDGWSVGDRVVGEGPRCGQCAYCLAGRPSLCRSGGMLSGGFDFTGFAEFTTCPAATLTRVPDGLDLRTAALTEPLAVSLHGISRGGVRPGMRVLISGAGPIGMFALAACVAQGVEVTVSEPGELRRSRALQVGAVAAVHPSELPEVPAMPFVTLEEGFDVVLECSGNRVAFETGMGLLVPGGTLVTVGTGLKRPQVDTNRLQLCELTLTGTFNYDEGGFATALQLLADGVLPVELLAEPVDTVLEELQPAMEGLASGQIAGKVLVTPKENA
jgi:(R,R)-butanediol dehydrogenase/meso-butanediol dehydrogenase/diacetyl reductase